MAAYMKGVENDLPVCTAKGKKKRSSASSSPPIMKPGIGSGQLKLPGGEHS